MSNNENINNENIDLQIRNLRKKLNEILVKKDYLIDSDIISISKKLDDLLNIYDKIKDNNK